MSESNMEDNRHRRRLYDFDYSDAQLSGLVIYLWKNTSASKAVYFERQRLSFDVRTVRIGQLSKLRKNRVVLYLASGSAIDVSNDERTFMQLNGGRGSSIVSSLSQQGCEIGRVVGYSGFSFTYRDMLSIRYSHIAWMTTIIIIVVVAVVHDRGQGGCDVHDELRGMAHGPTSFGKAANQMICVLAVASRTPPGFLPLVFPAN